MYATETCVFLEDHGPCSSEACQGPGATSEACMLVTAEYCAEHPEDAACDFLLLGYQRVVGDATLSFHHAHGATAVAAATQSLEHWGLNHS